MLAGPSAGPSCAAAPPRACTLDAGLRRCPRELPVRGARQRCPRRVGSRAKRRAADRANAASAAPATSGGARPRPRCSAPPRSPRRGARSSRCFSAHRSGRVGVLAAGRRPRRSCGAAAPVGGRPGRSARYVVAQHRPAARGWRQAGCATSAARPSDSSARLRAGASANATGRRAAGARPRLRPAASTACELRPAARRARRAASRDHHPVSEQMARGPRPPPCGPSVVTGTPGRTHAPASGGQSTRCAHGRARPVGPASRQRRAAAGTSARDQQRQSVHARGRSWPPTRRRPAPPRPRPSHGDRGRAGSSAGEPSARPRSDAPGAPRASAVTARASTCGCAEHRPAPADRGTA